MQNDPSAIATALQITRLLNTKNTDQVKPDLQITFSYGKVPYGGEGIHERKDEDFIPALFDFFYRNFFGLEADVAEHFLQDGPIRIFYQQKRKI